MYLYINTASPQGRSRLFGRRVRCPAPVPPPPPGRRIRAAWGKTAFRTDGINGVHIVFHAGLSVPPRLSGPGFLFHLAFCSAPAVWSGFLFHLAFCSAIVIFCRMPSGRFRRPERSIAIRPLGRAGDTGGRRQSSRPGFLPRLRFPKARFRKAWRLCRAEAGTALRSIVGSAAGRFGHSSSMPSSLIFR